MAKDKSVDKAAKGGVAALDRSPSHLLHRALQVALDVYADELGATGITQRQYAVLAAVEAREGLTQTDLVRITGIDRSTLADMVQRMIAKGLLDRERSTSDGRANAVRLSEAGRVALEDTRPKVASVDARLLKLLSSDKRDGFLSLLRDLIRGGEIAQAPAPIPLKPKKAKADRPPKPEKAAKAGGKKKKKAKKAA